MAFTLLYVTHASAEAANQLVDALLERRLIACANSFPIQSAYWWQGAISRETELVTLLKTSLERVAEVERAIEELHPYEVPCVMQLSVQANPAYEAWIQETTEDTEQ